MRAALPPTRATSEVSCERTGVCNPLRISAPGAVIAKDGWTLWKDGGAVSRWRLDGFFAFAPCAGSTDGCAVELVCVELVCTGSDGGGTYGGGTGAGSGAGACARAAPAPSASTSAETSTIHQTKSPNLCCRRPWTLTLRGSDRNSLLPEVIGVVHEVGGHDDKPQRWAHRLLRRRRHLEPRLLIV